MDSKSLKILFEGLVEAELLNSQFEILQNKYGEKSYVRKLEKRVEIISFIYAHYGRILSIQPHIGLNFDEIVDVYRKNSNYEGRPNKCIGNHLLEIDRYIKKGETTKRVFVNKRWEVIDQKQVVQLVNQIKDYFESVIMPYFEQNSTIKRVDFLLNKEPRIPSIHNNLIPLRACIGLISAKLNDNSKFIELISIYNDIVKNSAESYQEDYLRIRDYLINENHMYSE